jgi:hypothetical protein
MTSLFLMLICCLWVVVAADTAGGNTDEPHNFS